VVVVVVVVEVVDVVDGEGVVLFFVEVVNKLGELNEPPVDEKEAVDG
jgi:hypothetical protein